jgi:hypothetical protein
VDFPTTVQIIVRNAEDRGWKVAQLEPLRQSAAHPAGTGAVQVLELFRPEYTFDLVSKRRNRCVAMTPSSMVVYERAGQVYVTMVNTSVIGRFFRREARVP